jgi:hypothetical protein
MFSSKKCAGYLGYRRTDFRGVARHAWDDWASVNIGDTIRVFRETEAGKKIYEIQGII